MRTQLLGGFTVLLAGLALVTGPAGARAQYYSGYPQGYSGGYQAMPRGYWNTGYAQGYYPGYNYNRNYYNYNYPYYQNGYPQSYTSQPAQGTTAAPAATGEATPPAGQAAAPKTSGDATPPAACDTPLFQPVLPVVPLTADEIPGADGPGKPAAHHDRFWIMAGYDLSYIKQMPIATPLATTGSLGDLHPGALGQPNTQILFGNTATFQEFNGVRVDAGVYLDDCERCAIEFLGRYLIPDHVRYAAASDATGNPLIARPIFNAVDMNERAFADSIPGALAGGIDIDIRSELIGAELNARYSCRPCDSVRFDLLGGFRFLRLLEHLTVRDELTPLTTPGTVTFNLNAVNQGDVITDVDSFRAVNHFYGFQLGGALTWEGKWLFASAFGKAAIGWTDEEVDINGSTTLTTGGQSFIAGGGILALPSNIGQHEQTVFGFVPEGGLTVGVKIKPCLRILASYSFLYWNSVVRPGNQIDRVVNPALVPTDISFGTLTGPARPTFQFHEENFWVHTLTVGLDFRY